MLESLEKLDYESHLLTVNLGTPYLILIGWMLTSLIVLVAWPLGKNSKMYNWFLRVLFWNFLLRFILEESMQTWFASQINFPFIHDFYFLENESAVKASFMVHFDYFMTISLFLLTALIPIFIVTFYYLNQHKLDNRHFKRKYGAAYDGLKTNKTSLLFNAIFVVRRLAFSIAVFHGGDF